MNTKLLKGDEIAERLGVSKAYAYRLMSTGAIPTVKIGSRAIRVRPEDLEKYILTCFQETNNFEKNEQTGQESLDYKP